MSETARTRVVGYVRVSTSGQATEGVSLEAQRAKLRAYAEALDLELVAVHEDAGASAKSLDRPGLRAALTDLDDGRATALLTPKLDRLTRSVRDLGELLDRYFGKRCDLLCIHDSIDTRSAAGRLVVHVLGAVSQWEREATAERTVEALDHLRSQGVRLGGEALGWRRTDDVDDEGRRVAEEVEAEVETLRRIRELRGAGLSLRAICAALADEGRATKRGGQWSPSTVLAALRRTEVVDVKRRAA